VESNQNFNNNNSFFIDNIRNSVHNKQRTNSNEKTTIAVENPAAVAEEDNSSFPYFDTSFNTSNIEYSIGEDASLSIFDTKNHVIINNDIVVNNQEGNNNHYFMFPSSDLSIDSRSLRSFVDSPANASIPSSMSSNNNNRNDNNKDSKITTARIALKEEMNCLYDSISRTSSCTVKGSIQIKSSQGLEGNSFYLHIKDPKSHLENIKINDDASEWVKDTKLEAQDQDAKNPHCFLVDIPRGEYIANLPVCKYTCKSTALFLPMIVQTKVSIINKVCRVILLLTSNPSNKTKLSNLTILMAVPLEIDADTLKMSNTHDGYWDKMKRLLVWSVPELKSGRVFELHVQCGFMEEDTSTTTTTATTTTTTKKGPNKNPNFPVLVRCSSFRNQLSSIELVVNHVDGAPSSSVVLNQSQSYRVVYRKI